MAVRVISFDRAVQYVSKLILKSIICLEIKSKFSKPDRAKRDGFFQEWICVYELGKWMYSCVGNRFPTIRLSFHNISINKSSWVLILKLSIITADLEFRRLINPVKYVKGESNCRECIPDTTIHPLLQLKTQIHS